MTKRLSITLVLALAIVALFAIAPVSAATGTYIKQGAHVFIGEQGLNIAEAIDTGGAHDKLGWWASGNELTTAPSKTIYVPDASKNSFSISSEFIADTTGAWNWYRITTTGTVDTKPFLYVQDPRLELKVWDIAQGTDVSGKTVTQGTKLTFRIETNMVLDSTTDRRQADAMVKMKPLTDGFITIKVKTDNGVTLSSLYDNTKGTQSLAGQFVDKSEFYWTNYITGTGGIIPAVWSTDNISSIGQFVYPFGTYTVYAESNLNGMKDNYRNNGADFVKKTVSEQRTVTLASSTVKITASKDAVTRSKPFAVTITGVPNGTYYLWVKGTHTMTGLIDDQPPLISTSQEGVRMDNLTAPYSIGNLNIGGAAGSRTILMDVPSAPYNATGYYAKITTSTSGTRVVGFETNEYTKPQKYTIHVENGDPNDLKSDEVEIRVEKGGVFITTSGDGSYYLGEEIGFVGTNTETQFVYLFITGANLPVNGADISKPDPRNVAVVTGNKTYFKEVAVNSDNSWKWKWSTATVALDAGTYTVYAVSQPNDREHLTGTVYGTTSVIIKKPFVSASVSQSVAAKGDTIRIVGTAEGKPSPGIAIWVLGKNFVRYDTEAINSDASFSYEIKGDETKTLASGQYFVLVQHPMQNDQFDIARCAGSSGVAIDFVCNLQQGAASSQQIFRLEGSGSLQGSDAAEALVQALSSPNVDDTYSKIAFIIEEPIIRFDPITDKRVGEKFTITATTNLATGDEIFFETYSSSFKPTQKTQSGEFSGVTQTVKVVASNTSTMNMFSVNIDTSTFKADEYIVKASAIIQGTSGSTLFNVVTGDYVPPVQTFAPTPVPTKAAETPITPPPTPVQTVATPETTKTPTQPGFGALVALVGLGAVAFLVVRKR